MADLHKPVPAAWIDESGHPRHLSYLQGVRERQLYGTLRPLYDEAAIVAAVEALRDRCIDLVAMHGGSVEIEAAIRGA